MSKPNLTTIDSQPAQEAEAPQPFPLEAVDADPTLAAAKEGSVGKGNAEAAKYRIRLREVEFERDILKSSVETLQRQVVAGAMSQTTQLNADALWATGRNPGEFFDESGVLDNRKLREARDEVRGMLGLPPIGVVPEAGTGDYSGGRTVTWSDALKR